ncbi:hypothetical protein H1W37_18075 [Stappia taiwanensis]|uniref:Uncharacterized protein n=1 Tax=Stappia taiwanensis TaxID=992267 RepID=A0A838Y3X8_9HYPH|nr:hypothetical protein [Stappia taiwanensis]MBA4613570.1 hypothetical protein [Stappia taiwanensis]
MALTIRKANWLNSNGLGNSLLLSNRDADQLLALSIWVLRAATFRGDALRWQSRLLLLGFFFLTRTFFCRIDPSADPLSDLNNLTSQEAARTRRRDFVTHLG